MPRFAAESPVRVRVGDCSCPGTPHADGDFVTLNKRMSIEAGAAATQRLLRPGTNNVAVVAAVLPHMIEAWDFLDAETGEPLEITPETVTEALPWNEGGREVVQELTSILARPLPSKGSTRKTRKRSSTTPTEPTPLTSRPS